MTDYSNKGTKLEGNWENDRNARNRELFTQMIHEAFNTNQTIIAHHLVYSIQEDDNFLVEEIPSADTLIFDHDVMKKLFPNNWREVLTSLALTPAELRDEMLKDYYHRRVEKVAA